jgi:hypothetical protein
MQITLLSFLFKNFNIIKKDNQEMFAILLSLCSCYNIANFKLDQSVFAIHDSPLYFEISEGDHLRTVTHARNH